MLVFYLNRDEEEFKRVILENLKECDYIKIGIEKKKDFVNLFKNKEIYQMISLEEKIRELIKTIFWDKKGLIYKTVLHTVEKPLIEIILENTGGNKLKTAKLLGINRNTLESKIKRLKIDPLKFKLWNSEKNL